jgi:hypothetical protein
MARPSAAATSPSASSGSSTRSVRRARSRRTTPADRRRAPAHRAVGDAAARWRRSPGSSAATATTAVASGPVRSPSSTPASPRSSSSRSSSRSRTCPTSGRSWSSDASWSCPRAPLPPGRAPQHLAGGAPAPARPRARAPLDPDLRQRPPARRAAGRQAQRAPRRPQREPSCAPRASTGPTSRPRWPRPRRSRHRSSSRPPRVAVARTPAPGRGRAQVGTAPRAGRHLQPRARHRHGGGRPGRPGLLPRSGQPRAAAHRPRRPPGGRAVAWRAVPEVPRRPGRDRGRGPADARRGDRVHPLPTQPAGRARPADRGDGGDGRVGGRPTCPAGATLRSVRRAVRRGVARGPRPARGRYPSEEFSELGPASSGTAPRGRSGRAPAPSGWRSPTPARSPTAACSGCSCPTGPGRRARRGDGPRVPARARRSCSAPRPGGSRTSPTSGSWSPRHPASRASCRSGTATGPGARSSSGAAPSGLPARGPRRGSETDRDAEVARLRAEHDLDAWAADNLSPTSRSRSQATGDAARRPHHRRRALPRRARRLAGVPALPLRRAGPRPLGDGDRAAAHRRRLDPEVMWADDGIVLRLQESTATFGIPGAGGWEHDGGDGDRAPARPRSTTPR